jgi:hypothetical protein
MEIMHLSQYLTTFPSVRSPMPSVALVHSQARIDVPGVQLINKYDLFRNNIVLAASPYIVSSNVSLDILRQFTSTLEDHAIEITNLNLSDLSLLCDEFGFLSLRERLLELAEFF